ncbi:Uncharacterized protein Fot_02163 [Forsythia ovata]|uniref:Uncharacterized protein n=1 Tax=Forsythia ovata TaxID=205694 RepID=A0ABD1X622_9LAMI
MDVFKGRKWREERLSDLLSYSTLIWWARFSCPKGQAIMSPYEKSLFFLPFRKLHYRRVNIPFLRGLRSRRRFPLLLIITSIQMVGEGDFPSNGAKWHKEENCGAAEKLSCLEKLYWHYYLAEGVSYVVGHDNESRLVTKIDKVDVNKIEVRVKVEKSVCSSHFALKSEIGTRKEQ